MWVSSWNEKPTEARTCSLNSSSCLLCLAIDERLWRAGSSCLDSNVSTLLGAFLRRSSLLTDCSLWRQRHCLLQHHGTLSSLVSIVPQSLANKFQIFIESGYSTNSALLASMGTGILNWVFAIPAVFTIDKWGRRNLLLFTFPFLAIFLLWTGFSFWFQAPKAKVGMVTTGMYLFGEETCLSQ